MNPTRFLLPALLASPLLLALEPRGDNLTFHPAKDSSLTKSTEINMSFEIGDMTLMVNGSDMSGQVPSDFNGAMDMSMTWTDKYIELKDGKPGKPLEFIRSYDEMKGAMDMNAGGEANNKEIPDFDALAGKSIRFKWNDEKKDYDVAYHECDGDEKLLKTQQTDMDYLMMLPTKEVAVGDKWDVSTEFLSEFLKRMKNADMGDDAAEIQTIMQDELFPQMEKLLDKFKTTCTYKERRDEGGVDAAVISIAIEGKGDIDLKSMIESIMEETLKKAPTEVNFEITKASLGVSMTGKGELLWDIKAGHVLSAEQSADFTVNIGFDGSFEAQGQSQAIEAEVELPGKFTQKMSLKK